MDFKLKHAHDDGVVYKNSYETGAEWSGPGAPGEYQARSSNKDYAQNLAYSSYKLT